MKVAGKSGISQAHRRLGPEPLKKLFEVIVAPIAERQTKGAWYRGWRLISLDGSTLDTADTEENEKAFGRPGASRGASAFPKIRFWRTGNRTTRSVMASSPQGESSPRFQKQSSA